MQYLGGGDCERNAAFRRRCHRRRDVRRLLCGQDFRDGEANSLKVLVLDAGPFLIPTHVQNLPNIGLNVPDPLFPANDPGIPRDLVWGMAWRGNVPFIGQAYCVGGKSLYWGGWCPRLLASDLAAWPPTVATYLNNHYPILEQQTGVAVETDFIQGPLFNLLKQRVAGAIGTVANIDTAEDPPWPSKASLRHPVSSALTSTPARRSRSRRRETRPVSRTRSAGCSSSRTRM